MSRLFLPSLLLLGLSMIQSVDVMAQNAFETNFVNGINDPQIQRQLQSAQESESNDAAVLESSKPALSVANFLKSRFLGRQIVYVEPTSGRPYQGMISNVIQEGDVYYFLLLDRASKKTLKMKVVFETDYMASLYRNGNPTQFVDKTDGGVFQLQSEQQLTQMMSPLVSDGSSAATDANLANIVNRFKKTGPAVSEQLQYKVTSTSEEKKGNVVIVNNQLMTEDGTPLKITFERTDA